MLKIVFVFIVVDHVARSTAQVQSTNTADTAVDGGAIVPLIIQPVKAVQGGGVTEASSHREQEDLNEFGEAMAQMNNRRPPANELATVRSNAVTAEQETVTVRQPKITTVPTIIQLNTITQSIKPVDGHSKEQIVPDAIVNENTVYTNSPPQQVPTTIGVSQSSHTAHHAAHPVNERTTEPHAADQGDAVVVPINAAVNTRPITVQSVASSSAVPSQRRDETSAAVIADHRKPSTTPTSIVGQTKVVAANMFSFFIPKHTTEKR
jgi:hypothetical protein